MAEISRAEYERLVEEDRIAGEQFTATSAEFVDAYYEAETVAQEECFDVSDDPIAPGDVPAFLARAMTAAGYDPADGPPPVVLYDIEDESRWSGLVDDAGIHLHPKVVRPWLLLHELAHWLDPRAGHSPRWAYNFAQMVDGVLGVEPGARLRAEFDERGLPLHWLRQHRGR